MTLLALAGCIGPDDFRVLQELVYQSTDPGSGLTEDLHAEGVDVRARAVTGQCTAELGDGELRDLYRAVDPLFDDPPADAVSCTDCERWWLHLVDEAGETVDVEWSGGAPEALSALVEDLDRLWVDVLETGDCGAAPFTL